MLYYHTGQHKLDMWQELKKLPTVRSDAPKEPENRRAPSINRYERKRKDETRREVK